MIAGSTSALPEAFTGQTDRDHSTRPRTHQNLIYNVKRTTSKPPEGARNHAIPTDPPSGVIGHYAEFANFSVTPDCLPIAINTQPIAPGAIKLRHPQQNDYAIQAG